LCGDLRRDIDISHTQEDEIRKRVEIAESTGAIFDHADDAIDAFGDGIGQVGLDEGKNTVGVFAHGPDELLEWFQPTPHRGGGPVVEKSLRGR